MARKKTASGPVRYATYLRCSSDDQKHGDYATVDAQRQLNRGRIAESGGEFVGEYADEGKTGTNLNRPDWKRLLADAQAGKFDRVCVTYMSRLGRGNAFTIAEYELHKSGVGVEMVQEKFTDDLAGYITKQTTVMMDGLYPKMVSGWTKTKQAAMVAKGFYTGGVVPYGYQSVIAEDGAGFHKADSEPPRRLVPSPEQASFVLRAYELFRDTGGSYARVREYLNAVTDREWSLNTTINLLQRETYCGVLQFGGCRNEHAFEAVVPGELWEECQTLQRARTRAPKADPVDKSSFYLRGVIYCAHCGTRLSPANHHGRVARVRYYECTSCGRRTQACPVKRVNADSVHGAVLEHIRRVAEHPTRCNEVIRDAVKAMPTPEKMDAEQSALSRRLRDVEKRLKNVMATIEAGGAGVRSLVSRLQELETERTGIVEQRRQLEARIAETRIQRPDPAQVQSWFKDFLRLWDVATEEERQRLLPLIVDRVEMHEKERGLCRLLFTVQNPRSLQSATSRNVVINCIQGAGVGFEPTTFEL